MTEWRPDSRNVITLAPDPVAAVVEAVHIREATTEARARTEGGGAEGMVTATPSPVDRGRVAGDWRLDDLNNMAHLEPGHDHASRLVDDEGVDMANHPPSVVLDHEIVRLEVLDPRDPQRRRWRSTQRSMQDLLDARGTRLH
jgi:hypothetical protein